MITNQPYSTTFTKRHSINASIYKEQVKQATNGAIYPLTTLIKNTILTTLSIATLYLSIVIALV